MTRTTMTAAELAALPDGRYFDGTYEWDKEGDDWTPLRAPSGMPTQPMSVEARVTTLREPLHDPSAPAPAPSVVPETAVEALLRECDLADADMRKWVRAKEPDDREALARAVAHDGPGHPYGDAAYCGGCLAEREAPAPTLAALPKEPDHG